MSDLLGLIDAEQIYRGATPSCPSSEVWPNVEFLRHAAVLADVACPLPHLIANRLRHDSVGTTGGLLQGQPGLGLQEIDKAADSHIPLQFVAPLWRDLSLLVLLGQSTHMVCGLVAELPAEH